MLFFLHHREPFGKATDGLCAEFRRDDHRAGFVDKAPLSLDHDGGKPLLKAHGVLVDGGENLCAGRIDVAERFLFLCRRSKPFGEYPCRDVRLVCQAAAVAPVEDIFFVLLLDAGDAVIEFADVVVDDGQDLFPRRVVCAVLRPCVLHDDDILLKRMDGAVVGRNDDRSVEAHNAPCLSLADGDRVRRVGRDFIVLRRDREIAGGRDRAPFLAHADGGERFGCGLGGGGGRCLLCHLCRRCGRCLCRKSCGHRAEHAHRRHCCDHPAQLPVLCHGVISFENISSYDTYVAQQFPRWTWRR